MQNNKHHSGFTIVELLIVIVVIGILVGIVVVSYQGITRSALDASVKSDLKNFQKKIELLKAEKGSYPYYTELLASDGIKLNKAMYAAGGNNNWYFCTSLDRSRFAVGATALASRSGFVLDSATGLRTEPSVYGAITCPSTNVGDPYYGGYTTTGCAWASGACVWSAWIN